MGNQRLEKAATRLFAKGEISLEQYEGVKDLDADGLKKLAQLCKEGYLGGVGGHDSGDDAGEAKVH